MPVSKRKTNLTSYGLKVLYSNHKHIRRLKNKYKPTIHGHKVWITTWLLIDYLKKTNTISGYNVLDVGCGWGMAGIYCAKYCEAKVTCIDMDKEVFPYFNLLSIENKVKVNFVCMKIDQITNRILKDHDAIIASDICFSENLINQLRRLIKRAKNASLKQVIIADPGREPFNDLSSQFLKDSRSDIYYWKTNRPRYTTGKILDIRF